MCLNIEAWGREQLIENMVEIGENSDCKHFLLSHNSFNARKDKFNLLPHNQLSMTLGKQAF